MTAVCQLGFSEIKKSLPQYNAGGFEKFINAEIGYIYARNRLCTRLR